MPLPRPVPSRTPKKVPAAYEQANGTQPGPEPGAQKVLDVRELQHAPASLRTARPLSSRRQALLALAPVDGASAPSEFRVRASRAGCVIGPFLFGVKQRRADSGVSSDPHTTASAVTDREVALSWSSSKSR